MGSVETEEESGFWSLESGVENGVWRVEWRMDSRDWVEWRVVCSVYCILCVTRLKKSELGVLCLLSSVRELYQVLFRKGSLESPYRPLTSWHPESTRGPERGV